MADLHHRGAETIADVHTYGGTHIEQSGIDKANPMVATIGHIAIVVPILPIAHCVRTRAGFISTVAATSGRTSRAPSRPRAVRGALGVMIVPAAVHRTAKALVDAGEVDSIEAAEAELASYSLQIDVGASISGMYARQVVVLTAVNTAVRCFLGGVRVRIARDVTLEIGWDTGRLLSEVIDRFGGTIVDSSRPGRPTICVGDSGPGVGGDVVLRATFDWWTAGVVTGRTRHWRSAARSCLLASQLLGSQ